jgi:phosphoglycerate dehydrogenase-like enzyme
LAGRCRTLAGTRAVIAGYGRIGRAIGRKLEALGVSVEGFTRANVASLPAAAHTADWFVMALPSDTGTDGFLSRRLLAKLPRRCCVVNVGRGNAIDEEALLAGLRSGRIAGAYLDVFQGERTMRRGSVQAPRDEGPVLSLRASERPPNLFVMPHAAAFSPDYLVECFRELKREGLV